MYAVDFRNMRTAIHGLFVGKDRRRMERFHRRLSAICDDETSLEEEGIALDALLEEYPGIKFIEEVDYRRFHMNKKGVWGCLLNDKWCRIVNLVAVDIWCL